LVLGHAVPPLVAAHALLRQPSVVSARGMSPPRRASYDLPVVSANARSPAVVATASRGRAPHQRGAETALRHEGPPSCGASGVQVSGCLCVVVVHYSALPVLASCGREHNCGAMPPFHVRHGRYRARRRSI
jgi:hypothetical protein